MERRWTVGLALLEILLAMGILAVVTLAVVAVFAGGLQLMARSSEMATATEIARDFLERTRFAGQAVLPPGTSTFDGTVPDPIAPTGFPPAPYPQTVVEGRAYVLVVTSQPVPGTTGLRSVQVEVRWDERARVRLETYLTP